MSYFLGSLGPTLFFLCLFLLWCLLPWVYTHVFVPPPLTLPWILFLPRVVIFLSLYCPHRHPPHIFLYCAFCVEFKSPCILRDLLLFKSFLHISRGEFGKAVTKPGPSWKILPFLRGWMAVLFPCSSFFWKGVGLGFVACYLSGAFVFCSYHSRGFGDWRWKWPRKYRF